MRHSIMIAAAVMLTVGLYSPTTAAEKQPAASKPAGKGWMGMILQTTGNGVLVASVFKGTPAQKAGLQKGDLIVRMSTEAATSAAQLATWISTQRPGVKLIVALKRQGKLRQVTAVPADSRQAASVYRKACTGGDTDACTAAGGLFARGDGVPEDHVQAAAVWRKGCDAGAMDSCSGLGVLYMRGSGVTRDPGMGVQLYRKACDGGSMSGCSNLGQVYAMGAGVTKDSIKAAQLCRRACDGGVVAGCNHLARLYELGEGVAQDRARAVLLYRKACDGGYSEGCARLRALLGNNGTP